MANGSQFNPTNRDENILTDLYFTRILSTAQIATKYFNTYSSAKRRMSDLKHPELGMVVRHNPYAGTTIWMLTRKAFAREVEDLHHEGESYRDWPKPHAVPHFLDINDVFIDISEEMDEVLGGHPNWQWKNEPRSREPFKDGEGRCVHQPDAEITFGGNRYFLERQTERSRKTAEKIDERLDDYRRYIRRQRKEGFEGEFEVLFACDEERDMRYATKAAERHGVPMTPGKPGLIAEHLVSKARSTKLTSDE